VVESGLYGRLRSNAISPSRCLLRALASDLLQTFKRHPHTELSISVAALATVTAFVIKSVAHQFYKDLVAGKRPKLALMAPPQHGKSKAVNDFIAWLAGVNPDLKVIFSSFSDELGARANASSCSAPSSPTPSRGCSAAPWSASTIGCAIRA
jgi:hypothetical protein